MRRWPQALAVQARFIERGPWENGYMGPFNGKLLVREKFYTLTEARIDGTYHTCHARYRLRSSPRCRYRAFHIRQALRQRGPRRA